MKKILIAAGIGAVLIIFSLFVVSQTSSDETRPGIVTLAVNTNNIISVATLGERRLDSYPLQVIAATTRATKTSDFTQLGVFYKTQYGKALALPKIKKEEAAQVPTAILAAKEDGVDFTSQFQATLKELLQKNINQINSLRQTANSPQLQEILKVQLINSTNALDQLNKATPGANS